MIEDIFAGIGVAAFTGFVGMLVLYLAIKLTTG